MTTTEQRSRLAGEQLSVWTLVRKFTGSISITWLLALVETSLTAIAPLFIGFAIDGLLAGSKTDLMNLAMLLGTLIVIGVSRRLYDTRAYGTIRVELGKELAARASDNPVSTTNARLDMGRELADFLEEQVPQLLNSVVQLVVALIILWSFHPVLFTSALTTGIAVILIYALVHHRFFKLNGVLNHQTEQQVGVLSSKSAGGLTQHLLKLRSAEVKISDTEAYVYGAIFAVLLGFIIFNLWFATTNIEITVGRIFSIVSYSWEFVEAAIIFPATLQGWSRLSEISRRINSPAST